MSFFSFISLHLSVPLSPTLILSSSPFFSSLCVSFLFSVYPFSLCHASSPSLLLLVFLFSLPPRLFSLFYRTRLREETEVGWDPSGFDQVRIIITSQRLLVKDAFFWPEWHPGGHFSLSHSVRTLSGLLLCSFKAFSSRTATANEALWFLIKNTTESSHPSIAFPKKSAMIFLYF